MADLQLESSEIQWRRDFHDSAFWKSGLETDEDGKVSVAFNLPDNATTWTIRAWAATEDFHYGEGRGSIVAVKDKVIRPLLPKFLVEGDEIDMGIIVHNFTENGLQADANVSFDKRLLRSGPFAQEVTVSPKSMQRILWNVKAVEHGESAMKFSAIGDGIEIRIPVLPMAAAKGKCINTIFSKNGEFREWQFDIGENMLPGSVQFLFDDGTGLIGCVEAARHYLDKYEYTCTEQLASRICGLLETRQDGVELSQHERKKVEKALQFLEKRQFYDGSWPWFQGRGNIVFTCLAVRALIIADRHGFAFDKNMLENGVNYLLKYAKAKAIDSFESAEKGADGDDDEDYDDEDDMMQAIMKTIMPFDAYVAENLILGNPQNEPLPKKVHAFINRIYDARAMLPVHSLSVLCRLLHRLDDKRWMHVQELFDQYIYRNPDQWTAHISMGPESSNDFFDSMISTNAEFLRTMCETGICSTLKPRLVNYLLFNQMSDYSFDGTYGTSTVLRAFAPLMKDEAFKNSGTIDWELDGLPWTPQTSVGAGPHVLRAVKRGAGTAFASARLSWLEKDMQRIPLQSEQVSVSRSFQPLNGDGKTLRAGDMVRVIITLRLLNRMSYLRLSDPLLAGCIPSSQSLSFSGEYYREMHEKTTEFFIHELQPGEHTFSYMLLATHSGRFTALPTLVEPMYAPQFRAVGTAKKIIILPRR